MDNQDQQKLVVAAVAVVLLLFFFIVFFTAKSSRKPVVDSTRGTERAAEKTADSTETVRSILAKEPPRISALPKASAITSISGSKAVPRGGVGAFSAAELKTMLEEAESADREIEQLQQTLIMQNINDESLADRTRELNRLRAIKPYGLGLELYKEGRYSESMRQLLAALDDPLATPVTKYMTLVYLRSAAEKEKRFGLFLEFTKIQARLAADEDLSTLGITKTEFDEEWFELQNEYAKVIADPSYSEVILQKRIAESEPDDEEGLALEKTQLKDDIEDFKRHYGGFFAHVN